ncbi:histidine kinase [Lapillicoccus sp.]|uniref:sensor histidine kinase n=1 Tax=Lapillicoccus sp. TaxID=1909287 RepID=UPI0032640A36
MTAGSSPVTRLVAGPARDLVLAIGLGTVAVLALGVMGSSSAVRVFAVVAVLAVTCGCATLARTHPQAAALLAAPVLLASQLLTGTAQGACEGLLVVPVALLAFRLATRATPGRAFAGIALLATAWQAGGLLRDGADGVNPLIFFATVGPSAVGSIIASRSRARTELAEQAVELIRARDEYVEESVRFERTRIARELHDVVAHGVTAMVVQANAGQKLAGKSPEKARQAFEHIAGSARQSAADIRRLVLLIGADLPPVGRSITGLVEEARAEGLVVTCGSVDAVDLLDRPEADAAYAVVQEAMTNAMKHAPGSPIEVTVDARSGQVEVSVTNARGRDDGQRETGLGGRHGLVGMRERIEACGGTLVTHSTTEGGWSVWAGLPRRSG